MLTAFHGTNAVKSNKICQLIFSISVSRNSLQSVISSFLNWWLWLVQKPARGLSLTPPCLVGFLWNTYNKTLQLICLLRIPCVKPTVFLQLCISFIAVCCNPNQLKWAQAQIFIPSRNVNDLHGFCLMFYIVIIITSC